MTVEPTTLCVVPSQVHESLVCYSSIPASPVHGLCVNLQCVVCMCCIAITGDADTQYLKNFNFEEVVMGHESRVCYGSMPASPVHGLCVIYGVFDK